MPSDAFELRQLLAKAIPRRFRRGRFAEAPFLGYLDRLEQPGDALLVRGWILSRGTPLAGLCLSVGAHEIPMSFGLARGDVARALPGEPGAVQAGFALDVRIAGAIGPIEIWATLRDGRRLLAFRSPVPDGSRPVGPGRNRAPAAPPPVHVTVPEAGDPQLEVLMATHRPRVVVELDAPARETAVVAAARRAAPEATVYLVGAGLGAPDHAERVCVLDMTPARSLEYFTPGTVDLVLAHRDVPEGWEAKLRSGGVIVHARNGAVSK